MATAVNTSTPSSRHYIYGGLPRTGSTFLSTLLPKHCTAHEALLTQYLQAHDIASKKNDWDYFCAFIKRRHTILKLKYDILTMYSLHPKLVCNALPDARVIAFIREPLDWARSMCSYYFDILKINKYTVHDRTRANAYFSCTVPLMKADLFEQNWSSNVYQYDLLQELLYFWRKSTVALMQAVAGENYYICGLEQIMSNMESLLDYCEVDPLKVDARQFATNPINKSSYALATKDHMFEHYDCPELVDALGIYQMIVNRPNPQQSFALNGTVVHAASQVVSTGKGS